MTGPERDLEAIAEALLHRGYRVGQHGDELTVGHSDPPVDASISVDDRHVARLHVNGRPRPVDVTVPGSTEHADPQAVADSLRDLTR